MIRITYCPSCNSADENCRSCGEPVRALRTAHLTFPACSMCGRATRAYYEPATASLRYDRPGSFYVACPVYVEGSHALFDDRWLHAHESVPVSEAAGRRRIAIKLAVESKGQADDGW